MKRFRYIVAFAVGKPEYLLTLEQAAKSTWLNHRRLIVGGAKWHA
jgi:hypothetical protein